MTWFTASILISIKPESYREGAYEIYENMYLLEAKTAEDAHQRAKLLGQQEASICDDGLTVDGVAALREFLGVRKLISVSNPAPLDIDGDRPVSGTELTYALYQVAGDEEASKLASGEEVSVIYLE